MTSLPPETEVKRLRRKLRDTREDLREARAELARRPAVNALDDLPEADLRCLYVQAAPPTGNPCPHCQRVHPGPCQTCGGLHARSCPRVRSVRYTTQGDRVLIQEVTFWRDWDDTGIIWPDELPELPEVGGG
jgi:hypothetical protein